jgi:hypothetical protein
VKRLKKSQNKIWQNKKAVYLCHPFSGNKEGEKERVL